MDIKLANGKSVLYQCVLFAYYVTPYALVAQLDRVLPSEGRGRGFESRQAHHLILLNILKKQSLKCRNEPLLF